MFARNGFGNETSVAADIEMNAGAGRRPMAPQEFRRLTVGAIKADDVVALRLLLLIHGVASQLITMGSVKVILRELADFVLLVDRIGQQLVLFPASKLICRLHQAGFR